MIEAATLPAWFGKLPALGDFASRRMDPALLAWWDAWLAQGLIDQQEQHRLRGSAWLDAYLVSPSWQFLLSPGCLPGALGRLPWLGSLMPSVDRVGRYFPFLIVQPLSALPQTGHAWRAVQARMQQLDACAADALEHDWGVEQLEAELAEALRRSPLLPPSRATESSAAVPGQWVDAGTQPVHSHADPVLDEALLLWAQRAAEAPDTARSYWRSQAVGQDAIWRVGAGMPMRAADLLGGSA